jgi:hypothetical protein
VLAVVAEAIAHMDWELVDMGARELARHPAECGTTLVFLREPRSKDLFSTRAGGRNSATLGRVARNSGLAPADRDGLTTVERSPDVAVTQEQPRR